MEVAPKIKNLERLCIHTITTKPLEFEVACANSGKCHINDDMQELYEKIITADGLVFGTPIP